MFRMAVRSPSSDQWLRVYPHSIEQAAEYVSRLWGPSRRLQFDSMDLLLFDHPLEADRRAIVFPPKPVMVEVEDDPYGSRWDGESDPDAWKQC